MAELAPREDAPAVMRKLPSRRGPAAPGPARQLTPDTVGASASALGPDAALPPGFEGHQDHGEAEGLQLTPDTVALPARAASVEPLAPARFKVQFTADAEFHDKLERLQALTRSAVPDGDLGRVIELAVTRELERLEARRFAKTKTPRKGLSETDTAPTSRHIPAAVRRVVHQRDGGRCTYKDRQGQRCSKRHDLEFHHRTPFARGGAHSPDVLCLMCRTHNALMADHDFGKEVMARYRRPVSRGSEPRASNGTTAAPPTAAPGPLETAGALTLGRSCRALPSSGGLFRGATVRRVSRCCYRELLRRTSKVKLLRMRGLTKGGDPSSASLAGRR